METARIAAAQHRQRLAQASARRRQLAEGALFRRPVFRDALAAAALGAAGALLRLADRLVRSPHQPVGC